MENRKLLVCAIVLVSFLLSGYMFNDPKKLGVKNGALAECPTTPNCVCTQTKDFEKKMEPIKYTTSLDDAMKTLIAILEDTPRTKIVKSTRIYVHATFTTKVLNVIDDIEFLFDDANKTIQFRSASRVGATDFGANRKRMTEIRSRFANAIQQVPAKGSMVQGSSKPAPLVSKDLNIKPFGEDIKSVVYSWGETPRDEYAAEPKEYAAPTPIAISNPGVTISSPVLPAAPIKTYRKKGSGMSPINYIFGLDNAMIQLKGIINTQHGSKILKSKPDYLQVRLRGAKYGKDQEVEFFFDETNKLITFRFSSKNGSIDAKENQELIDIIRENFEG